MTTLFKLRDFFAPVIILVVFCLFTLIFVGGVFLAAFSIISILAISFIVIKLNILFKTDRGLVMKNSILMGALDSSLSAMIVFDKAFKCVFINDLANLLFQNKHISGYDDVVSALRPERHVKDALVNLREHFNQKSNYIDISILESEYVWWRISLNTLKVDTNLIVLTITDITPSIRYIKDFDNNPSFLKNCLDKNPVGFLCVNASNEVVFCNDYLLKLFNVTKDEIINTKADNIIKDTRPLSARNHGDGHVLHSSITKGGAQIHLLIQSVFAKDGIIAYSITEERRNSVILDALSVSKTYFDYIFEDAPMSIVITDGPDMIRASNNTFKKLLNNDNVEGSSILDFIACDHKNKLKEQLLRVATEENCKLGHIEVSLDIHKKNTIVVYLDRLKTGFSDAVSIIIYLLDISEFKELETRLLQSQKMQAIGQLAGGVAHDFNNLLTAMIGYSDLLLSRYSPSDASFNDVMQIKQNANRASNLVKKLLAFSRKQTLQPKVLDITEVLAEISTLLQRLIGPKIELKVEYCKDPYLIKVDEIQIEQVIMNLVVNARDAMENGGTLVIRISNVESTHDQVMNDITVPKGSYLLLEISDTGNGIPPKYFDRIFDPFFSTKSKGQGTGLGLATVYGIIRQTGGFIGFESIVNRGTTFKVYFQPAHEDPVEAVIDYKEKKQKYTTDLTGSGIILLVEDEDAVRMFSARALREKGYNVIEANSGEDALNFMQSSSETIDLIVTDVIMPKMDGVELVAKIREFIPDIKVIFISGYTDDKIENLINKGDMTYFLAKPFTLKDLAAKVKEVL